MKNQEVNLNELLQVIGAKEVDIYSLRKQIFELQQENSSLHATIKELEKDTLKENKDGS